MQRGPGDFLGTANDGAVRQSGGLRFRLADAGEDVSTLNDATEDARKLIAEDPDLGTHTGLASRVHEMFSIEAGLIS